MDRLCLNEVIVVEDDDKLVGDDSDLVDQNGQDVLGRRRLSGLKRAQHAFPDGAGRFLSDLNPFDAGRPFRAQGQGPVDGNPQRPGRLDAVQQDVVGTGLAGGAAAATLGELGYNVLAFCIQDSARRAHSIAAQGGINAAKNYQGDGDSFYRLFYDTVKGGDYRSREANVYRLAEVSNNIIDQCVGQGVPFAREYGGMLDNRSFGGALVSRTFYARGQTGQQLLLGAYSALSRQVKLGKVKSINREEMVDLVLIDNVLGQVFISREPLGPGEVRARFEVEPAQNRFERGQVAVDIA